MDVENSCVYGSSQSAPTLLKMRNDHELECSQAHHNASFGYHADGIIANCYIHGNLRKDLGPPPPILDYRIACDLDQSKLSVQVTKFHT